MNRAYRAVDRAQSGATNGPVSANPEFGQSNAEVQATVAALSQPGATGQRVGLKPAFFDFVAGADRPVARDQHQGSLEYVDMNISPFIKGEGDGRAVDPNDVKQGSIADCYLCGALIAIAKARPEIIERGIRDNGDGTYDVQLYEWVSNLLVFGGYEATTVTVDGAFLANKGSSSPRYMRAGDESKDGEGQVTIEAWAMLYEKAIATHHGGYNEIGEGGISHEVMALVMGESSRSFRPHSKSEDELAAFFQTCIDKNIPCTLGFYKPERVAEGDRELYDKHAIVGWHVNALDSVDVDAKTVTLINPWGHSHPTDVPLSVIRKLCSRVYVAGE